MCVYHQNHAYIPSQLSFFFVYLIYPPLLSLSLSLTHTHTVTHIIISSPVLKAMERKSFVLVLILLQLLFWVCVTRSRPFLPNPVYHFTAPQGPAPSPFTLDSKEVSSVSGNDQVKEEEELISYGKMNKIGSSPPNCQHKCYGCSPCQPTQVPTIVSRVGLQYTNYEPESWKCKCGPSFYSP